MKLNPNFKLEKVAGEYILLDARTDSVDLNKVFSMNEPAAWLWRKIGAQEFDEHLLVSWICDEYDVDPGLAESDVCKMLMLWDKFGMLL